MPKMQEKEFIELVNAHITDGIVNINIYVNYAGSVGGYVITAQSDSMSAVHLSSARKEFRSFATIDSAAKFLRSIGIGGFQCFTTKQLES